MNKRLSNGLLLLFIVGMMAGLVYLILPRQQEQTQAQFTGLPESQGNFQRADGSLMLEFPRDFGPQPDFQTEWWYYTGNLDTADGRHFGYQLTFFRRAIEAPDQRVPRESAWAADQVYMAHFTLTDVTSQRFHAFERFSRGAVGLAGATIAPEFQVWLENWRVEQVEAGLYRLQARTDDLTLDLTLEDATGPILQGQMGYSQKGPQKENASYYFSQPRLLSQGKITLGGQVFEVQGTSWMDREFSTSALGSDEIGWDWFALQLDDGSEVMLYSIRRSDGSLSPFSSGTLIRADGSTRSLTKTDFIIQSTSTWRSPHNGANYPSGWTIEIPAEKIRLTVKPYLDDQELQVSVVYWEGAVSVRGERDGQTLTGSGYVELTGYAGSMRGRL